MNYRSTVCFVISALSSTYLLSAPAAKVSSIADRTQTIEKSEKILALAPQDVEKIANPFIVRPDPAADQNRANSALLANTEAAGAIILQNLNPSGILRRGDDVYLQFQGGSKAKAGDAYTVSIGKNQYVIQITKIGTDDFEFTYQGKSFSRLIKSK
jgi:hypothetical protein